MRVSVAILFISVLAGCVSTPRQDVRVAEVYKRHASDETVRGVRYTSVRSWRPVSDEGVLIEFNGNRHFLFALSGACRSEIRFARKIAISTNAISRLDLFDRIALNNNWCRIQEIREVDFKAAKAEVAALNAAPEAPQDVDNSDASHRDDYSGGT